MKSNQEIIQMGLELYRQWLNMHCKFNEDDEYELTDFETQPICEGETNYKFFLVYVNDGEVGCELYIWYDEERDTVVKLLQEFDLSFTDVWGTVSMEGVYGEVKDWKNWTPWGKLGFFNLPKEEEGR